MAEPSVSPSMREAVGLFDRAESLEKAVQDLLTAGFDHADISVLGQEQVLRIKLAPNIDESSQKIADIAEAPHAGFAEPESRAEAKGALAGILGYAGAVSAAALSFATGGGAIIAVAAGLVAAGTGAALGAALSRVLDKRFADHFQHQIEKGGIVLWVRLTTPMQEQKALAILNAKGGHDVHAHDLMGSYR